MIRRAAIIIAHETTTLHCYSIGCELEMWHEGVVCGSNKLLILLFVNIKQEK